MSLLTKIDADLKQALKDKDQFKLGTLRMILAGLKNEKIAKGEDLTDEDVEKVLRKEAKKRQEAIEMFKKADRKELVKKEADELKLIEAYLPKQMDKDEIEALIKKAKELGEWSDDFGNNMKLMIKKTKGRADGGMVASLVKQNL